MKDIEDLLSRYWALAYHEGKTGESRGDEANEVLFELRAAVEADRAQRVPEDSDLWCGYVAEMVGAYIKEPVGSEKVKAIAGIIRRRMPTRFFASTPVQPAQQEPDGFVVSAQVDHCVVRWTKQTSKKGGGDPKNSYSWPITGDAVYLQAPPKPVERKPMTDEEIERGRKETFSTENPFCPCDSKTMRKAVRWAERHHGIRE